MFIALRQVMRLRRDVCLRQVMCALRARSGGFSSGESSDLSTSSGSFLAALSSEEKAFGEFTNAPARTAFCIKMHVFRNFTFLLHKDALYCNQTIRRCGFFRMRKS
jgi:hypothetical protein